MGMFLNINSPVVKLKRGEKLIIDTNILLITFFSKIIEKRNPYKEKYQNYVHSCLSNKIELYTTEINLYEGLHVIDKTNLDIYNRAQSSNLSLKEFHKIEKEVEKSREDMSVFYNCIKKSIKILPSDSFEKIFTEDFFNSNNCLDICDYALIKIANINNIYNILTDDSDFISDKTLIKDFNIFTQNSIILNQFQ